MSEFDQLYREVILDHYKNPRGHGTMDDPDADAEGMNPLCGDEVSIYVRFGDDRETIEEVKFAGRGCANDWTDRGGVLSTRGKEIRLPAGSTFSVRLLEPVTVRVRVG